MSFLHAQCLDYIHLASLRTVHPSPAPLCHFVCDLHCSEVSAYKLVEFSESVFIGEVLRQGTEEMLHSAWVGVSPVCASLTSLHLLLSCIHPSIHPPIHSLIQPSIHLSTLLFRPPFISSALWPTSLTNVCVGERKRDRRLNTCLRAS